MNFNLQNKLYFIKNKIKDIIKNMNNNQKLKLLLVILISIIMICCKDPFHVKSKYIWKSIVFLFYLALFAPGFAFSVLFAIFSISLVAEMHFLRIYGFSFHQMGEQFLNVMVDTNLDEIIAYINILAFHEVFFIVLILCIALYLFNVKPIKKDKFYLWIVVFIIAIMFGYTGRYIKEYNRNRDEFKKEATIINQSKKFNWDINIKENIPNNVVVLVGEAHRYDYFTKYWKQKNPIKNLLYFNDMISQYGYTLKAMPQILSRKNVHENTIFYQENSILKLYEKAGYETHFVTYLPKLHKGDDSINFITLEAQNYHKYGKTHDGIIIDDGEVPEILDTIFKNGKKNFVVIKLIGVHYNFQDRYIDDYDFIKPSLKQKDLPPDAKNKQIYLNTYENAMRYSTDVIYNIFKKIEQQVDSSLIFFSSDHAFNIFDNGKWGTANVKQSFHIPFMIYGNDKFMNNVDKNKWKNLKNNIDSPLIENDILETIVSLSNIEINQPRNRDLTKNSKVSGKREVIFSDKSYHIYEDIK